MPLTLRAVFGGWSFGRQTRGGPNTASLVTVNLTGICFLRHLDHDVCNGLTQQGIGKAIYYELAPNMQARP